MRNRLAVLLVSSLATLGAAGCGEPTEEPDDTADAGAAIDSGLEQDAGAQADASLPDAGLDAGSTDAGSAVDAGAVDAGPCATWGDYDYAEPDCGPKPLRVQFNGSQAITDTGLDVYDVRWDFGDGYTSWATNPTHTFWQAGDFDVVLKLTADYDGMDVTVTMPPVKIRAWDP